MKRRVLRRVTRQSAEAVSEDQDQIALSENQMPEEIRASDSPQVFFSCFQCGNPVNRTAERCPKCGVRYISEHVPDCQGIEDMAQYLLENQKCVLDKLTCMYFDVDDGTISCTGFSSYVEGAVECQHCGILVETPLKKCPICGHMLPKHSVELAEIVNDVEIGEDLEDQINSEIICPICGENCKLNDGRCVKCDTQLITLENDPKYRLRPLLPTGSVLFVHLDIETGAISYIERGKNTKESGKVIINLGTIGADGTDIDWKSADKT